MRLSMERAWEGWVDDGRPLSGVVVEVMAVGEDA